MLATALAFGLLSEVAEFFSESYGASFVFPPAGVSLAAAIEAKDPTTVGHVQRVARPAERVGRELGLGERAPHRPATGSVFGGNFGHGAGQVS